MRARAAESAAGSGGSGARGVAAYALVALLASAFAFALWAARGNLPVLDRIDRLALDAQTLWRGPLSPDPKHPILLLSLDDNSLRRTAGAAPDRRQIAEAVRLLKAARASVVVLDLLLLEPTGSDPSADADLASALRDAGNVLIPFALPVEPAAPTGSKLPPREILDSAYPRTRGGEAARHVALQPDRMVFPLPQIAAGAAALGHVTVQRGTDGAVRFDLPGLSLDGEVYPSMALRIAASARGLHWQDAEMQFGEAANVGDSLHVPVDAASRQWVNYYGAAGRFETHGLGELLTGQLKPDTLRGRIVLIGASALGSGDNFPTPFDGGLPGLERLATVVDNILSQRVLIRPTWAAPAEIAAMLVLPLLSAVLIGAWPQRRALPALALLACALMAVLQWIFIARHEFTAWSFPAVALVLAILGATAVRAGLEGTRREAAMAALRASEERYALAASGANDGLWDWDIVQDRVYFSERWFALMGPDGAACACMCAFTAPLSPMAARAFDAALADHLEGRSLQFHHVLSFQQGGRDRWLLARGVAVRAGGRPLRMAGSLTDISEPQRLQRQMHFDAMHDRLTGLPNRALFREQLAQLLNGSETHGVGVLLLDIDGFRSFNESQGPQAGDAVLKELALRLRGRDDPSLVIARLGPDEFGIAFTAPFNAPSSEPGALLDWARAQLSSGFAINGEYVKLSACIGWSCRGIDKQGVDRADELIAETEDALFRAKELGSGQVYAFDPEEQRQDQGRRWIRDNIDRALRSGGQFELHYQPFVRLSDRSLMGFEALIRWRHPERGTIMPGDFIPEAELSGQITAIGRWALLEAAAQLRRWVSQGFAGEVAVNLSGVQLAHEAQLLNDVRDTLETLGPVPPRQLKLEVTEGIAMANPQRTAETLQEIANMGFKLSIDDFGTGYSSLAYLHRFPFDTLKIDRSFVMRLAAGREAQEIVRTIVNLALTLGKQTLAEGVESEEQAALLERLGVKVAQGWLFSKALPAAQAQGLFAALPWHSSESQTRSILVSGA